MVAQDDKKYLRRPEDLTGCAVTMEDGFITAGKVEQKYPDIRLILVKDTPTALLQVSWRRTDAYKRSTRDRQ